MEKTGFETRALEGLSLGVSISLSNDASDRGFSNSDVNMAVRDVSRAVLAQGGRVVFGHDWRPDGVMGEVFALAVKYHSGTAQPTTGSPQIRNFVPWPNTSSVAQAERARYQDVLEIIETARPHDSSGNATLHFVKSLSQMRAQMTQACDARLCIGGVVSGAKGKCAGVVEEAFLTLDSDKPLYVTGLFGGASQHFIDALKGQNADRRDAFKTPPDVAKAMTQTNQPVPEYGIDPDTVAEFGLGPVSQANFLSPAENEALFKATQLREVVGFTLMGLGRIARHRAASGPV